MRYYRFVLNADAEQIEKNTKIRLKNYDFDNTIAAVNRYFHRNIENNIGFFIYREENGCLLAVFAYDEKKTTYSYAYGHIQSMLNEAFRLNQVREEPSEITMYEFCDYIIEGKRRWTLNSSLNIIERAKVFVYDYVINNEKSFCYDFSEKVISGENKKINGIYDESLRNELANIKAHKNETEFAGNMVHYVISCRSVEAAGDMTKVLMRELAAANRISGRRMEIVSNLDPDLYKKSNNRLEDFIENNYGGVVVIDMSERFGCSPVEYAMTCQYIGKLVKRYKNDCLFVFTYNMEKPGFAYQLLPLVEKQVLTVKLKEGKGDRKTAAAYLKELIAASEYAKYAEQAEEFLRQFPEKSFTQTDVLEAFEKFEPWCLNKNMKNVYSFDMEKTTVLERDTDSQVAYEKLQTMTGLAAVKKQIAQIIAADTLEKERKKRLGKAYEEKSMHMLFCGNPGTAKTTVARLFAEIARTKGILKSGIVVEKSGTDFLGVDSVRNAFAAAKGGVLFIDEAYAFTGSIAALIQEMENRRNDVIVILAGYNERMEDFMKRNEGLKSRIPYQIDFPDYSTDELTEIFQKMLAERGFHATDAAIREAGNIFEKARTLEAFGNGRYVRNLLEHSLQKQSERLVASRESVEKIGRKGGFVHDCG